MANPETNNNDTQNLNEDFSMKVDIKNIKIDKSGTLKSRLVLIFSLTAFFFPYIPALISLSLIPSARRQIQESDGKLTGLRMIKWGKGLSWASILIDTLGLIALILIFIAGKETLIELCILENNVPEFCPLVEAIY